MQTARSTAYSDTCIIRYFARYIFDIPLYYYVHVCVRTTFYDLSALVGCWCSVSIRRIIYTFLNVFTCDYTVVAVSGKVERS